MNGMKLIFIIVFILTTIAVSINEAIKKTKMVQYSDDIIAKYGLKI